MLIGFAGPAGSGKTTAARMVAGRFGMFSFAAPLKRGVREIFGFTTEQLYTLEGKQAIDPIWGISPREALQFLGTDCLRERWPDFWIRRMGHALDCVTDVADEIIAIDDCRFPNELQMVRDRGGIIVHIIGRKASLTPEQEAHASEQSLDVMVGDHTLDNSGDLDDLKRKLHRLISYERGEKE